MMAENKLNEFLSQRMVPENDVSTYCHVSQGILSFLFLVALCLLLDEYCWQFLIFVA